MKALVTVLLASLAMMACTAPSKKSEDTTDKKVLVLYYSQTGATKTVAEYIQQKLGADIAEVQAKEAYPEDFQQTVARGMKEMQEGVNPELLPLEVNPADYDVIFLGYPIWFGTYALPVKTLLQNIDLSGKEVVVFSTFGSGGLNESIAELQKAVPGINIIGKLGVRNALLDRVSAEADRLLIDLGMMEGENETLADYSEQQPVTEADTAIFNAAVGDYPMLSATPVTVGSRTTSTSIDYLFTAENAGQDGQKSTIKVYVTKGKAEGDQPVFTLVDR